MFNENTDALFEEVYNPQILTNLREQLGSYEQHHVELHASTEVMVTLIEKLREKKHRRGEVVMVVPTQTGKIWLHTKAFYPDDAYRLMTGGIDGGEAPEVALRREVLEETGFQVDVERCLAVITYALHSGSNGTEATLPFVSYVFLTTPGKGMPQPVDPGEAISGFKAVAPKQLLNCGEQLRSLNGRFKDWGAFRAVAHDITATALLDEVT